jgi:hypothetical protein
MLTDKKCWSQCILLCTCIGAATYRLYKVLDHQGRVLKDFASVDQLQITSNAWQFQTCSTNLAGAVRNATARLSPFEHLGLGFHHIPLLCGAECLLGWLREAQ